MTFPLCCGAIAQRLRAIPFCLGPPFAWSACVCVWWRTSLVGSPRGERTGNPVGVSRWGRKVPPVEKGCARCDGREGPPLRRRKRIPPTPKRARVNTRKIRPCPFRLLVVKGNQRRKGKAVAYRNILYYYSTGIDKRGGVWYCIGDTRAKTAYSPFVGVYQKDLSVCQNGGPFLIPIRERDKHHLAAFYRVPFVLARGRGKVANLARCNGGEVSPRGGQSRYQTARVEQTANGNGGEISEDIDTKPRKTGRCGVCGVPCP